MVVFAQWEKFKCSNTVVSLFYEPRPHQKIGFAPIMLIASIIAPQTCCFSYGQIRHSDIQVQVAEKQERKTKLSLKKKLFYCCLQNRVSCQNKKTLIHKMPLMPFQNISWAKPAIY